MFLFVAEISGPESPIKFAEIFREQIIGKFREQGMVAAIWTESGTGNRNIIQGWTRETLFNSPPQFIVEQIQRIVNLVGWKATPRIFSSIGNLSFLPRPSGPSGPSVCDMPNNSHTLVPGRVKFCPQGHVFTDDHNITNCVICSNVLS